MPANADLRQLLLTRTDLTRLGVPAARVLRWLASGSLEQIGTVPFGNETDPVFAVYSVDLQHELDAQLREVGRADVALGPLAARSQYLRHGLQQRGIDASEVLAAQPDDDGYGVPFAMRLLGSDLIERIRTEAPELANVVDEVLALCAETAQSILPQEFTASTDSTWPEATSAEEIADDEAADSGSDEAQAQGESWLDVDALSAGLEQLSASGDETGAGTGGDEDVEAAAAEVVIGDAVDHGAVEAKPSTDAADAADEPALADAAAATADRTATADAPPIAPMVEPVLASVVATAMDSQDVVDDDADVAERMARSAAEAEAVIEEAIAAVDACFGKLGLPEAPEGDPAPGPMPDLLAGTFLAELAEQTSMATARTHSTPTAAAGAGLAPATEAATGADTGLGEPGSATQTETHPGEDVAGDLASETIPDESGEERYFDVGTPSGPEGAEHAGEDDEDSCVASDPGIASIVRGSLASMEIDDVFAGEDAVDLDPLAGNFLADDGEDTLIDYHPHTQPAGSAQASKTVPSPEPSTRSEQRKRSLIDPEELAALTPTEQPFVAAASATIASELPVIEAMPSRLDKLAHVVESGFERVLTSLERLDRLGELAKLDKLGKLGKLDKLDLLDALPRLEKLDKLEKLDLLDKLGRLDGLGALDTLAQPTAAPAAQAPREDDAAATVVATPPSADSADLREAIERSAAVTVAAIQALPRQLRPAPASARSSTRNGALLFATGLLLLCWAGVLWLRSGDPWLTTAALVAANVLGCAMLAFRRN